jgi:hypothetical protein
MRSMSNGFARRQGLCICTYSGVYNSEYTRGLKSNRRYLRTGGVGEEPGVKASGSFQKSGIVVLFSSMLTHEQIASLEAQVAACARHRVAQHGDDYLAREKGADEQAAMAKEPETRAAWERIAAGYRDLAIMAENRSRLLK